MILEIPHRNRFENQGLDFVNLKVGDRPRPMNAHILDAIDAPAPYMFQAGLPWAGAPGEMVAPCIAFEDEKRIQKRHSPK